MPGKSTLLAHIGLAKPYRFERTLVALSAITLVILIGCVALYLELRGQLTIGTPRGWYVIYLLGLVALALALAPFPRTAAVLLSLAAVEAGFGFGSLALYKVRLIPSPILAPSDDDGRASRYAWHPLLQVVPVPTLDNHATPINAEGVRGREWSAAELRGKTLVALFGGSTTFEGLHPEGLTWADRLQALLPASYAVVNHGMDGYTSAEHVIQTAFYERTRGVSPGCAVYFMGANDLRSSHVRDLDSGYADFHLPSQVDGFRIRRSDADYSISPLVIFLGRLLGTAFDTIRPAIPQGEVSGDPDPVLEEIFARNVATISAINRQRAIRTIWIGVLLDPRHLTAETASSWAPFVRYKDLPRLMERLNALLKRQAEALGDVHVELPGEAFEQGGFRDHVHFTEEGSLIFARLLAPMIIEHCRDLLRAKGADGG